MTYGSPRALQFRECQPADTRPAGETERPGRRGHRRSGRQVRSWVFGCSSVVGIRLFFSCRYSVVLQLWGDRSDPFRRRAGRRTARRVQASAMDRRTLLEVQPPPRRAQGDDRRRSRRSGRGSRPRGRRDGSGARWRRDPVCRDPSRLLLGPAVPCPGTRCRNRRARHRAVPTDKCRQVAYAE